MKKVFSIFLVLGIYAGVNSQPTVVNIHLDNGGQDAVVTNASPGSNYGSAGQFNVYWSGSIYRTYLKADFSSIPTNAIVTNAKLKLTATANDFSAAQSIDLCRASASWSEGTVTWTGQPGFSGSQIASFTTPNSTGLHTLTHANLIIHVQHMINYPSLNYGWCLKMASESGSTRGLTYKSREATATLPVSRPYVEVTYILPIEVAGTVTHCSEGHDDGAITSIVATEGSETYSNYAWYKYNMGTVTSLGSGSTMTSKTGLSDGLYLVQVTDNLGYTGYSYFLIGEENTTTTVEFSNSDNTNSALFNEDALLTYTISGGDGTVTGGTSTGIVASRNTTTYLYSLLKYKVKFDAALFYESAQLVLRGVTNGHIFTSGGSNSNATKFSRITQQWYENTVNWNTMPTDNTTTPAAVTIGASTAGTSTVNSTIDVLNFVNYWSANPTQNFGLLFTINTSMPATQQMAYNSYDYTTHSGRPKLVLTYTLGHPTSYFELSEAPQGSFYRVTDDLLRIKYTEEYMDLDGALTYRIKNSAGTIVMDETDEAQMITYGDNRMRIDVSSLSNGFYTFELTNEREEKWYLRFEVA